ncbi:hypothetical protein SELMODRAFT_432637 [Selaginella moellendorffii]|uniref:Uncharacterized protein n=2 Tax=Selaginella moellendorffii TaxID=88036 RepID=D8TGL8_SELML|nr:uncharacterized protein LOC9661328 [Selaginella moellendorffii]EFJ04199.1 hypothetical protein SELMODRAFT_432637 [Selaginella moellendorffii]|eukprot:XP_024518190.1 uncharacterized protein LOC9661328 [Selaginella moellendorffii]
MVMELPPMDLVTKVLDSSDLTGEKAVVAKMMKELQEKHPIQLQYDADVLLHALCKPWEVGGHAYDFKKCHRQLRITDPYQTYSTDQVLLQWHERVVAEREAWNRQRQLKAHMLFLLSKLQVAERQRRRTIGSQALYLSIVTELR